MTPKSRADETGLIVLPRNVSDISVGSLWSSCRVPVGANSLGRKVTLYSPVWTKEKDSICLVAASQ